MSGRDQTWIFGHRNSLSNGFLKPTNAKRAKLRQIYIKSVRAVNIYAYVFYLSKWTTIKLKVLHEKVNTLIHFKYFFVASTNSFNFLRIPNNILCERSLGLYTICMFHTISIIFSLLSPSTCLQIYSFNCNKSFWIVGTIKGAQIIRN